MKTAAEFDATLPAGSLIAPSTGRSSLLVSLWALYLLTLRQHMHGKRWIVMAILFMLPGGLALIVRMTAPDAPSVAMEFVFAFMLAPQAILPLLALLYASGMIQDELEDQTFTYLLIRPIPKWALYLVKLLATLTATVVLTCLFTALMYAAIYLGTGNSDALARCLRAMAINSLSVVTYCCLFGLLSLLTKRVLVVGIIYMAVVEGMLANLPFSIRLVTVIYYSRMIAYRTMEFMVSTPHGDENIAAEAWQLDIRKDPHLLNHPSLSASIQVLLITSLVCAVLTAWLCSRREFHLKTPETSG